MQRKQTDKQKNLVDQSLINMKNVDKKSLLKSIGQSSESQGWVCASPFSDITVEVHQEMVVHFKKWSSSRLCILGEPYFWLKKCAPNLRDRLIRSFLPYGNFSCHNCVQSNAIIRSDCFSHPHSGHKFPKKAGFHAELNLLCVFSSVRVACVGKMKGELRIHIFDELGILMTCLVQWDAFIVLAIMCVHWDFRTWKKLNLWIQQEIRKSFEKGFTATWSVLDPRVADWIP